jgi:uncharacterized repeat protein (TIGR04138 family)
MESEFYKKLRSILKSDSRYKLEAYEFLMQALFYAQSKLDRQGHVSGKELLFGIKEYGVQQFGPLAQTVFEQWGVKNTLDFGEIVFSLVNNGLLKKTDEDSLEDFKEVYEFKDAFRKEYEKNLSEDIRRELSLPDDTKEKDNKKV